ncbi:hypothetical protein C8R44DRAFT_865309 [Mycena epipterygia]|nr:hypothetical protein C8R44DRAFT_865309 [Mycena epipterygia]
MNCFQGSNLVFPPIRQDHSPRLRLQSLQIVFLKGVSDWITQPSCPLDLSALKAMSINSNTEILQCEKIQPALQTIVVLDFIPNDIKLSIDLASLPNFTRLRIGVSRGQAGRSVSETLATIASTNSIRKIIIFSTVLITNGLSLLLSFRCRERSMIVQYRSCFACMRKKWLHTVVID